MRTAFWLAGATALALAGPAYAGDTIKIGFVSTFSGPTAVIGNDMRNSFELALDHLGRKMGGKPVEVIYEDDGQKRSEEHTSELQSPYDLVCRLLLEKKKKKMHTKTNDT